MWQAWMRYIRNFFGFSRSEALGFSVMAMVLLLVYAAWLLMPLLPQQAYHPGADQRQLDSLMALLEATDTTAFQEAGVGEEAISTGSIALFNFNPNLLPYDSLLLLGLSPSIARRLVNYRQKGGRFRKKEELQKIYGFPPELYQQLEPWIFIPTEAPKPPPGRREVVQPYSPAPETGKKPVNATLEKFELNKADSLQLVSVRGIGPVLSSRILKFREALGGFVSAEQLREVWGLSPEAADALLQRVYLSPNTPIRKLQINQATAQELALHPYINAKQAGWIVAYRSQHGPFSGAGDLQKITQLDDNFAEKLAPYLQF